MLAPPLLLLVTPPAAEQVKNGAKDGTRFTFVTAGCNAALGGAFPAPGLLLLNDELASFFLAVFGAIALLSLTCGCAGGGSYRAGYAAVLLGVLTFAALVLACCLWIADCTRGDHSISGGT